MTDTKPILRLRAALVAVTALLLAASPLEWALHILPQRRLGGIERKARPVPLSWAAWKDGAFAHSFEAWYGQRFGGRPWFVLCANQLRYRALGVLPRTRGTSVTLGEDHWLFENAYIKEYIGKTAIAVPEAGDKALPRLRALADFCASNGVAFAVIVSPSKAVVYPEKMPPEFRTPATTPHGRDVILPKLRTAGIPVVDAHALFLDWKNEPGAPLLFAPTGTHWTYDAAWRILLEALRVARPQTKPFVTPATTRETRVAEPPDRDLCALINLLHFDAPDEESVPYPVFATGESVPANWPTTRVGMLGDSFCHALADLLARSGLDHTTEYLYYGRRLYHSTPRGPNEPADIEGGDPIDWTRFDFPAWLKGLDVFLLECNEIMLQQDWWWEHAEP